MSFAILLDRPKIIHNIGTAMRSCFNFGASSIITIGRRYGRESSDTPDTGAHIPIFHFNTFDDYLNSSLRWPHIGIEIVENSINIKNFVHPKSAVYMFGPEDGSLSKKAQSICCAMVQIPTNQCLNLAVTASCVMFDRLMKQKS